MRTTSFLIACAASMSMVLVSGQSSKTAPAAKPVGTGQAADASTQRALVDKYCVTCHNQKALTGNLALDKLDLGHLGEHAEVGEKVVRKLRAGMMPPTGMPRPDAATMNNLITWMEGELDRNAVTYLPPPGLQDRKSVV